MLAVLDPCLVAPHRGQTIVEVGAYLESVTALRRDLVQNSLSLLASDEIYVILETHNLFPLRESIEAFLVGQDHDLAGAGADVARLLLDILARAESVEDHLGAYELATTTNNAADVLAPMCSCHPDFNDSTRNALDAAMAVSALEPAYKLDFLASHRVASTPYVAVNEYRTILSADGAFEIGPASIGFSVPIACTLDDALSVLDPGEILRCADVDTRLVELAIRAACLQQVPPVRGHGWLLGAQFIADIAVPSIRNNESLRRKVLRACCEIIGQTNVADSHPLRTGAGGSNPQVRSGIYQAWRQDVDYEWHIHFWKADGGLIQLASLRGHNYMGIPDPVS